MQVMSGWARQPLRELTALPKIITHPQPIPTFGHLHLLLLIFHAECRLFAILADRLLRAQKQPTIHSMDAYCKETCKSSQSAMFFYLAARKGDLKTVADESFETEHVWRVHKQDVLALGGVPPSSFFFFFCFVVCLSHWIYVIAYSCVKCRPSWPRDKTLI